MNSKEFVMILLDCFNGKIESATRVQKLAFLVIKEFPNISPFTNFRWRDFGPFSSELSRSINELRRNGFVRVKKEERATFMGDPYQITIFWLTDKGQGHIEKVKSKIESDDLRAVYSIVEQYGYDTLTEILNYVYGAYSPADL